MMHSHLDKALDLAKRTGDRILVVDRYDAHAGYVILPMDEYERFLEDEGSNESWDDWNKPGYAGEEDEDTGHTRAMSDMPDEEEDGSNLFDISEEEAFFNEMEQESGEELDNKPEYGKINNQFEDNQSTDTKDSRAQNRWKIANEIKRAGNETAPGYGFGGQDYEKESSDDRYYLESI